MRVNKEYIIEALEKYIKEGYLKKNTFGEELYNLCKVYSEKVALIEGNQTIKYKELWQRVCSRAKSYEEMGFKYKDNIILQLPNSIEFIINFFAMTLIGVRPVLSLLSHRKTELINIAKLSEAKAIITISKFFGYEYASLAKEVKNEVSSIKNIILVDKYQFWESNKEFSSNFNDFKYRTKYYDIALFLLSGGTTGTPKLIPKMHCSYIYNAKASAKYCCISSEDTYLLTLSISHDYPLCNPGILGTLVSGGKVVIAHTSSYDEIFPLIEKYKVTFTQNVPQVVALWYEGMEYDDEEYDISSLNKILIGAAKLDRDLAKKIIEKLDCKLLQGYGLGEGVTCFTGYDYDFEAMISSQGKPISLGDSIKIVDNMGNEVANGEAGELVQKGPYTFFGYYRAPQLNKDAFTEDGYFKTGDKALITKEGNVRILGRIREQINRAGENVIPSEIETLIRKHEAINNATVLGLPDKDLGECTCAVLIANNGYKELTRHEICEFLTNEGVAMYKFPDVIYYVKSFPLKNIGKVDKKKIKKAIMLDNIK